MVDESEGDTSKICPNCGISLPLTANMCYCCKYVFNATGTLHMNNQAGYHTGTLTNNKPIGYHTGTLATGNQSAYSTGPLTSNYQSRVGNVYQNNNQRYPSMGRARSSSESTRKTAMIICLIGSIICGIATFLPYIGVTILGTHSSVCIMDNIEYGIENLFWAAASIIFCIPKRQKNGTGHIILGVIGLAGCIYNSIRISNLFKYSELVQKEVGFYALLIGSIMVLASGIIMRVASKNE